MLKIDTTVLYSSRTSRPWYAPVYVSVVQTIRLFKNIRRRIKKMIKRFFKKCADLLYLAFVSPFVLFRNKQIRAAMARLFASTVIVACIFCAIGFHVKYTNALAVSYQGEIIGYVQNATVLEEGIQKAKQIMYFFDMQESPSLSFSFAPRKKILDGEKTANAIVHCHSNTLTQGAGLFVNGQYIGALEDKTQLEQLLEEIRISAEDGTEIKPSIFAQKVEITDGAYPKQTVFSKEDMRKTLLSSKSAPVYYTVKSGDNLTKIARNTGLTLTQLRKLNPAYTASDILHIGDSLLIKESSAVIQVRTYKKVTYTESIPYETKIYFDRNHFTDEQRLVQKGVNGQQTVTAEIEYTDGVETGRTVLSTIVTKKPVKRKIQVGTVSGSRPQGNGIATGDFMWPLPGFSTITSPYGPRWGTVHQGLDISGYNAYGKGIVASDGGVVYAVNATNSWGSGMFAGYGYAVIIDHGNGYRTLYAHCSRVIVKAGQKVSKGQTIAYVGNTGKSTGPHLHFEIRRNNSRINPLPYLR